MRSIHILRAYEFFERKYVCEKDKEISIDLKSGIYQNNYYKTLRRNERTEILSEILEKC